MSAGDLTSWDQLQGAVSIALMVAVLVAGVAVWTRYRRRVLLAAAQASYWASWCLEVASDRLLARAMGRGEDR